MVKKVFAFSFIEIPAYAGMTCECGRNDNVLLLICVYLCASVVKVKNIVNWLAG